MTLKIKKNQKTENHNNTERALNNWFRFLLFLDYNQNKILSLLDSTCINYREKRKIRTIFWDGGSNCKKKYEYDTTLIYKVLNYKFKLKI